jgi:hypothetical protein
VRPGAGSRGGLHCHVGGDPLRTVKAGWNRRRRRRGHCTHTG